MNCKETVDVPRLVGLAFCAFIAMQMSVAKAFNYGEHYAITYVAFARACLSINESDRPEICNKHFAECLAHHVATAGDYIEVTNKINFEKKKLFTSELPEKTKKLQSFNKECDWPIEQGAKFDESDTKLRSQLKAVSFEPEKWTPEYLLMAKLVKTNVEHFQPRALDTALALIKEWKDSKSATGKWHALAFALHFQEDAFAAGHNGVDRDPLKHDLDQSHHDYYNQHGMLLRTENTSFYGRGDGHLSEATIYMSAVQLKGKSFAEFLDIINPLSKDLIGDLAYNINSQGFNLTYKLNTLGEEISRLDEKEMLVVSIPTFDAVSRSALDELADTIDLVICGKDVNVKECKLVTKIVAEEQPTYQNLNLDVCPKEISNKSSKYSYVCNASEDVVRASEVAIKLFLIASQSDDLQGYYSLLPLGYSGVTVESEMVFTYDYHSVTTAKTFYAYPFMDNELQWRAKTIGQIQEIPKISSEEYNLGVGFGVIRNIDQRYWSAELNSVSLYQKERFEKWAPSYFTVERGYKKDNTCCLLRIGFGSALDIPSLSFYDNVFVPYIAGRGTIDTELDGSIDAVIGINVVLGNWHIFMEYTDQMAVSDEDKDFGATISVGLRKSNISRHSKTEGR